MFGRAGIRVFVLGAVVVVHGATVASPATAAIGPCGAASATIVGTPGDDLLVGTAGPT